ncbi:hypothetical protein KO493_03275 [Tamlana agarivorans]|uniref:Uncharacterized protein n=1 Tax=Pseudotamlana agarivorans TaxID=481183 RepID=A0ACC5U5Z4_9FLAO|nr:hypothetical protein [Tamlana agarivorans]MBU2949715.1 hypothetical protein [Tamlana agarivorans]
MYYIQKIIQELESLSADGVCTLAKIKWWLLKHQDDYNKIQKEESKRFMYFVDGKSIRLPDYIGARTPNEKFLHIYNTLNDVTVKHEYEEYFRNEMAIYKSVKEDNQKLRNWLVKNEHLGVNTYFIFLIDYFGEEDEMDNETHLNITFLEDEERRLFIDRKDFQFTIEFAHTFNKVYWDLLEVLNLEKLN